VDTRGTIQLSDMWMSNEESDRDDRSEAVPISERQAALKKSMCSRRHPRERQGWVRTFVQQPGVLRCVDNSPAQQPVETRHQAADTSSAVGDYRLKVWCIGV
jgi:hypothetical protein